MPLRLMPAVKDSLTPFRARLRSHKRGTSRQALQAVIAPEQSHSLQTPKRYFSPHIAQHGYGSGNRPKQLIRTPDPRPPRRSSMVGATLTTEVTHCDEPPGRTSKPGVTRSLRDAQKQPGVLFTIHTVITRSSVALPKTLLKNRHTARQSPYANRPASSRGGWPTGLAGPTRRRADATRPRRGA